MAFACLVQVLVMTINVILGPTKLALSLKLTVRYVGRMTDAVVYKLYSLRPLSTAANQQVAVSTCTHSNVLWQLSSSLWLFTRGGSRTLCSCANWRYRNLEGAPIGRKGLSRLFIFIAYAHHGRSVISP